MENFKKITKQQSPARTIAFGFAVLIFIGAALLSLPIAVRGAVQLPGLDALFTATSAVCVTGLVTVDPGDTFTLFGQAVLAVLMQLGGLGISSVSMGLAIAAGRRISFRGRSLVREALNVESFGGMVKLVRSIMAMTLLVEGIGAVASYPVFARDYSPLHAAWISVFHAIASFNNAGLDVLGGGHSLIPYCNNLWLNLVTDGMIVLGGIGFMVMLDVLRCRGRFRKLTLHSKVVLSTTAVLILGGAMLLWLTEPISFLAALFQSITTRTAGFSTIDIGAMTNAGLLVIMILMFIGASPGSTGGGIKTTTFFVLMQECASSSPSADWVRSGAACRRKAWPKPLPSRCWAPSWCLWAPSCSACWSRSTVLCSCCLSRSRPTARRACRWASPPACMPPAKRC